MDLKSGISGKRSRNGKGSRLQTVFNHAVLHTKRRADLANFNKLSLDALTGIAYADDSQIAKLTIAHA
jgi:Holliday junction resolvase RusA-like endonuclease